MPCWEVRTVAVEFQAGHTDLIMTAARAIGFAPVFYEDENVIRMNDRLTIDLNHQTAQVSGNDFDTLNRLKRAYARTVIETVAKRKRWGIRKIADNQLRVRRY